MVILKKKTLIIRLTIIRWTMILSTISISRLNVVFDLKLKSNISIEIKHLIQPSKATNTKYKSTQFHHHWAQQLLIYTKCIYTFTCKITCFTNYNTMNVVLLQPKNPIPCGLYTVYWFTLSVCISLQTITTNYIYYNYLI